MNAWWDTGADGHRVRLTLGETVHHVDQRICCGGCTARVYTFATATDAAGAPVYYFCRHCANRIRGVTLCLGCSRPLRQVAGLMWVHRDNKKYGHSAVPETERDMPCGLPQLSPSA